MLMLRRFPNGTQLLIIFVVASLHFISYRLQSVVRRIESTKTKSGDRPEQDVVIYDCGTLPVDTPFSVDKNDAQE